MYDSVLISTFLHYHVLLHTGNVKLYIHNYIITRKNYIKKKVLSASIMITLYKPNAVINFLTYTRTW